MEMSAERQQEEWLRLRNLITKILAPLGSLYDSGKGGDYLLYEDNLGWCLHELEFQNLELFRPEVVKSLQALLADFPKWHITIRVDAPGTAGKLPGMGLILSPEKIIDQLQRQYLPEQFRHYVY
jgi:hypothetical protein